MTAPKKVLVTGGFGCIGSAAVAALLTRGHDVVVGDLETRNYRLSYWLGDEAAQAIPHVELDIRDYDTLCRTIENRGITNILHLAALQTPHCQKHRRLGMESNVGGTFNVFEAALTYKGQVTGLAIASSVAAEGATPGSTPEFFYGAWKQCGEAMAYNFALHCGIGSVSLEPYIVFGRGRDTGMTSALTKAVVATVAGKPYHIPFGGNVLVQDVGYVGECFARAALLEQSSAEICKVGGTAVSVADFVEELERQSDAASVTWDDARPLPFPAAENDIALKGLLGLDLVQPDLPAMIADWLKVARRLYGEGKLDLSQLNQ